MFSKLQLYILVGCALVAAIVFAVFEYRSVVPSGDFAGSTSDSSDYSERSPSQPPSEPTSPATPKPERKQTSLSIITNGNEADEKIIDAVMEKIASSFKTDDRSYAIEVMYTPVLESFGGKEKAMESAKEVMEQMKEQKMQISWKLKKPYTYVAGNSRKYALIPYEAEVIVSGRTMKQMGYELGIKTAESGWQFVGGDRLSPEIYEQFFPDFPKDVEIPELQQNWEN